VTIRQVDADELVSTAPAFGALLVDAVEGGASVSFVDVPSPAEAAAFWLELVPDVRAGFRLLLGAFEADGTLVGTVQVARARQLNQPHRGDVAKLLVHRAARGRGVGAALMHAAEAAARAAGLSLLVLDTWPGSAAYDLYVRLGWTLVGVIPNYALDRHGDPVDTAIFYKNLRT
jgi:ribosomal protein S18 acetylase RimI-like enzyme